MLDVLVSFDAEQKSKFITEFNELILAKPLNK